MSLRLISSVFLHLLKHLFFGGTLLAARTTRRMAFVIVMLVIGAAAEFRRIWVLRVHLDILVACPAMHQARPAYNS